MPWTPGTELTKPAVNAAQVEESTLDLFSEFLKGYFTGGTFTINEKAVKFFNAIVAFQQAHLPQPLDDVTNGTPDGVAIQLVLIKESRVRITRIAAEFRAFQNFRITLFLRAQGPNKNLGGPEIRVRELGGMVTNLFNNKVATQFLNRKGIRQIRCHAPMLLQNDKYSMREMQLVGQLQYPTESAP